MSTTLSPVASGYTSNISIVTTSNRQHQNKNYNLNIDAYSRERIKKRLRTEKLSAFDGALKDLQYILGTNSRDRETLRMLLSNLFVAWCTVGNPFVSVPMGTQEYRRGSRLHALHLRRDKVRLMVTALDEHEFVEQHRGYFDSARQIGRCTRIRADQRLIDLFVHHALSIRSFRREKELIVLRGDDKKPINISRGPLAAVARHLRPGLITINSMLASTEIQLVLQEDEFINTFVLARDGKSKPVTPPNPCSVTLRRVFNRDFRHGGRFYGPWWQGLPRSLRSKILINGYPVVELDYKSLHPRLLFLQEGITISDDPYIIPPYVAAYRSVFKLMLNCGINAVSPEAAMHAVRGEISRNQQLCHKFRDCLYDRWLKDAWEAMCQHHASIAKHLGTGAGLRLQRLDSDMAEHIMLELSEKDIPVLCIHDSFIVPNIHELALYAAMIKAARKFAGGIIPIENKMPQNSLFETSLFSYSA